MSQPEFADRFRRFGLISLFLGALPFSAPGLDSSSTLEIVVQAGHQANVSAIAFTPDDDFLVSFSDQQMKVWETKSGLLVDSDDRWPSSAGGSVALSFDGESVAATMSTPQGLEIAILDRHSHAEIHHAPNMTGGSAMAFSRDGRYLAIGVTGRSPTITIWDTKMNSFSSMSALIPGEVPTPTNTTYGIWALAFSPDGKKVASGRNDRLIVWDIADRRALINKQIVARATVTSVEFDEKSGILVGTAKGLYRLNSDSDRLTPVGNNGIVSALRFDHKYGRLANGSAKILEVTELPTNRTSTFGENLALHYGTAISEEGSQWATLGVPEANSAGVWDLDSGRRMSVISADQPQGGAVFIHKNILATSSFEAITIWNVLTSAVVKRIPRTSGGWFGAMDSCPGANLLLALDGGSTQEIRVWRSGDDSGLRWGSEDQPIKVPPMSRYIAVSPDCLQVAVTGGLTTFAVTVFDLASRKEVPLEQIKDNKQFSYDSLAFSPDGKLLAAASSRNAGILLWDARTGKALESLPALTSPFSKLSFSSDSNHLAYIDNQGNLSAWDVKTKLPLSNVHTSDHYTAVHFLPGKDMFVVTGQNTFVTLWQIGKTAASASVFTFPDKWLVLDAAGFFDTNSFDNTTFLRWRIPGDQLHLYPVEVLMRDFYQPSVLTRVLDLEHFQQVKSVLLLNRVQPLVEVERAKWQDAMTGLAKVTVKVSGNKDTFPRSGKMVEVSTGVYDLRVFRDGQLVKWTPKSSVDWQLEAPPTGPNADELDLQRWREKTRVALDADGTKHLTFSVQVPRRKDLKQVTFTAYAFNEDRVKGATASRTLQVTSALRARTGKAYIISIGVNRTESSPNWDLQYAANDARRMSEVVTEKLRATHQFSEVVPVLLVSDQPGKGKAGEAEATKAHLHTVLDVLAGRRQVNEGMKSDVPGAEGLEKAQPEDLVLLAFSSHGYTDPRGVFHMVLADIGKQPQNRITEELQRRTLSSDEVSGWLREVDAGELVMIVDTCHSEATVAYDGFKPGPMGSRGLGQLAYDKGMRILAASKSGQSAIELGGEIKEGLLSYALVHEGLDEGKADFQPKDGKILMSEWLAYGAQEVPNLFSLGKAKGPSGGKPTVKNTRDIVYLGPDHAPPSYQQPVLFDFAKSTPDVILSSE